MTTRKVMRGAELRRIGNDLVLTDRYPDGTTQTSARPIEEWLIIKAWIEELSEDHDGAVAPDPHPSPEEEAETGEVGGCTRTAGQETPSRRSIFVAFPAECDVCHRVGVYGTVCNCGRGMHLVPGVKGPVTAIADGEVRRA